MIEISRKKLTVTVIICLVLGALVGIGSSWLITTGGGEVKKIPVSKYEKYQELDERFSYANDIYNKIQQYYYEDIDEDQLSEGICEGLVYGLGDDYSEYLTKEEKESLELTYSDDYDGIGVTFGQATDGSFVIITITEDSPADKAGLEVGDIITLVDGNSYDDIEDCSSAIRGKAGTDVELTYKRNGKKHTLTITRATIESESVEYEMLEDNIGYVQITGFHQETGENFKAAIEALESKDAKGLIIDLRDNSGGLVAQAQVVADELLDKGIIVCLEGNNGQKEYINSTDGKTDLPYVLLVNGNTASASEIVSAAVQDNDGGEIVGTKTFGKGIIQNTYDLKDGCGLKLTVAQYFSPDGNKINGKGIKPDYKVKNTGDDDAQLEKAIELLK